MESDDKDDGYSEEEEEETCPELVFRNPAEIDESMIVHLPGNSMTGERMTVRLLVEFTDSTHSAPRQYAARQILESLQFAVTAVEAYSEQDDLEKVFAYINKLSEDNETKVRCNLLTALPKVASFCAEYDSPLISLKHFIDSDILPIVLKAIADEDKNCNMRVRKEGYSTLKYLLKENLVNQQSIEDKICLICRSLLAHPTNFINLITAGNFLARMPPVVGEAATEKLLLPKISDFCSNRHPKVREACVHFLIDLACYVNSLVTENIIIPLFIKLSEDSAGCVRKTCAETAVVLSCLCLMESRKTVLCRAFLDLLCDLDNSVMCVACKQLGAFITTFAQPALTALGSSRSGDFLLIYHKNFIFELLSRRSLFQFYEQELPDECSVYMLMFPMKTGTTLNNVSAIGPNDPINNTESEIYIKEQDSYSNNFGNIRNHFSECSNISINDENSDPIEKDRLSKENEFVNVQYENQPDLVQSCFQKSDISTKSKCYEKMTSENVSESLDDFNSFQYWRDPIPDFDEQDVCLTEIKSDLLSRNLNMTLQKQSLRHYKTNKKYRAISGHIFLRKKYEVDNLEGELSSVSGYDWTGVYKNTLKQQNILPQSLLDAFISMSETTTVDIRMNCAYFFPAVLLTVGAINWPLLKNGYFKLAKDSDRKLRKLVASSIHEIASILGPDLATQDLIPIYNSLINDLEDIRITALNHLSCFVKLLKPHGRCMFLPHLMEVMITDCTWNWRFRKQLSEQLIEMMEYFAPSDCWKFVLPVAFTLLMDRVSAVRLQALNLVTHLIRIVSSDITLLRGILAELAEQFAHSTQWARRQSFAFLCSCLMKTPVLPDDMFARDVLPHLLDLSWDSIPNVRIAVARTLSCDVITHPFFSNIFNPHYDILTQVLKRLCKDNDRDVRYFASLNISSLPPIISLERSRQKSERR